MRRAQAYRWATGVASVCGCTSTARRCGRSVGTLLLSIAVRPVSRPAFRRSGHSFAYCIHNIGAHRIARVNNQGKLNKILRSAATSNHTACSYCNHFGSATSGLASFRLPPDPLRPLSLLPASSSIPSWALPLLPAGTPMLSISTLMAEQAPVTDYRRVGSITTVRDITMFQVCMIRAASMPP